MTTDTTASTFEPSDADYAEADRAFTCMAARGLVEKAMTFSEKRELAIAFGFGSDVDRFLSEQEAYAQDHIAQGACDWS